MQEKLWNCIFFPGLCDFSRQYFQNSQYLVATHFSLVCIQTPKWLRLPVTHPWCFGANTQRIHCTTHRHTHTHCKGNEQLHYTNTKRFKNQFLHCGSICFQCDARSPQWWQRQKGPDQRHNCSSCSRNMDGTLTFLDRLICVSIPLAAGFTVHWLLQNYSSSK